MNPFRKRQPPPFPVAGGRIPDAYGQADDEIGVTGPPWNMQERQAMVLQRNRDKKYPMRTPVYGRRYIQRGISSSLSYHGMREGQSCVPGQIRSSAFQQIHINKVQISKYISWIKPFGMAPGYPTAKVVTLINTTPAQSDRPRPRINRPGGAPAQPRVANRGTMRPPQRFTKALPVALVPYNPPVYGSR